MYLFGGSYNFNSNPNVYCLDLRKFNWELIKVRGDVPAARDEHTAVLHDETVILFGGFVSGERTSEMFKYHIPSKTWEKIELADPSEPQPCPRAGHSAIIYDHSQGRYTNPDDGAPSGPGMYIFGGKDEENNKLNDLWCYHLDSNRWEHIVVSDPESVPMARSGHSANVYMDQMVIFGGIFEITKELNDMPLFDLKNRRWVHLFEETKQSSPIKTGLGGLSPMRRKTIVKMGLAQESPGPGMSLNKSTS